MHIRAFVALLFAIAALGRMPSASMATQAPGAAEAAADTTDTLRAGRHAFYTGQYLDAAEHALSVRRVDPDGLASYELRTSALHFQLKRAIGRASKDEKPRVLKACEPCVGSSRVDLQACKLEYSIVSPK